MSEHIGGALMVVFISAMVAALGGAAGAGCERRYVRGQAIERGHAEMALLSNGKKEFQWIDHRREKRMVAPRIEIRTNGKLDEAKRFYFVGIAGNGEVVAISEEYTTKENCEHGTRVLRDMILQSCPTVENLKYKGSTGEDLPGGGE